MTNTRKLLIAAVVALLIIIIYFSQQDDHAAADADQADAISFDERKKRYDHEMSLKNEMARRLMNMQKDLEQWRHRGGADKVPAVDSIKNENNYAPENLHLNDKYETFDEKKAEQRMLKKREQNNQDDDNKNDNNNNENQKQENTNNHHHAASSSFSTSTVSLASYDPFTPVLDVDSDASCAARTRHWTLVIGIPSVDLDRGLQRRLLQRETWLKYASVAGGGGGGGGRGTSRQKNLLSSCSVSSSSVSSSSSSSSNNKRQEQQKQEEQEQENENRNGDGAGGGGGGGPQILTRFLFGLHPAHNYKVSTALLQNESKRFNDIIVLNMKEGRVSTSKTPGGAGYWGLEAEVGMSRKAFLWYCLATRYENADFVAKADDDLYLRANVVTVILNAYLNSHHSHLHKNKKYQKKNDNEKEWSVKIGNEQQENINHDQKNNNRRRREDDRDDADDEPFFYWGRVMKWGAVKNDPQSRFPFVGGMFVCMNMKLARWIKSSPVARRNNLLPYQENSVKKYKETNHDHEDVMVGRWLYDAKIFSDYSSSSSPSSSSLSASVLKKNSKNISINVISDCRFHDVHVGANKSPVRGTSIGLHHLRVDEYHSFMKKYRDDDFAALCRDYGKHAARRVLAANRGAGEFTKRIGRVNVTLMC